MVEDEGLALLQINGLILKVSNPYFRSLGVEDKGHRSIHLL